MNNNDKTISLISAGMMLHRKFNKPAPVCNTCLVESSTRRQQSCMTAAVTSADSNTFQQCSDRDAILIPLRGHIFLKHDVICNQTIMTTTFS